MFMSSKKIQTQSYVLNTMKSPTMSVKTHFKRFYVVHNHEVLAKWWCIMVVTQRQNAWQHL